MKRKDILQIINQSSIMSQRLVEMQYCASHRDGKFIGIPPEDKLPDAYKQAKKEYEEWLEGEV